MADLKAYRKFVEEKIRMASLRGVPCEPSEIHPALYPHQRDIVKWAVEGGQRAIFAQFGLGKSLMQLEILRILQEKKGGRGLIIAPLGVRQEFKRDAEKIGLRIHFIRRTEEVEASNHNLFITNYESARDGKLDPGLFTAVSLDEASVLRSYGSKTYQEFLPLFDSVKYKFVATATPSPNRYKELIHYAGFLGIMDTGAALTRFFQRDSQKANNLTLYPHKEKEFWLWMHSWAIFLQKPSELGYSDEGYDLPDLKMHYHMVCPGNEPAKERDGQNLLFAEAALGLKEAAKEKRESMEVRIDKMKEILESDPESHYILWHDLEAERHAIKKAVPEAAEVHGSLDLETREQRIIDFSDGKIQYLATKPEISGSGCNFQRHCHKCIFLGIGYKFNDFIQSIHRIHRFLQDHVCEVHVIYSESETEILRVLLQKWEQHKELMANMSELVAKYGLNRLSTEALRRDIGVERRVERGKRFEVTHNDCVEEAALQPDNSVGLIITSIPFSNHYEYSLNYADYGHTDDNDHFWKQMDFLSPELLRILQPGRLACIHVKDRILFGNATGKGVPTVSPLHAEAIFHYMKHGFDYMGMITVITDVVRENNQTYRLGWSENAKDGTKMGVGSPEYILLFRKPQTDRMKAYADVPVSKPKDEYSRARWQIDAHSFWRSSGNRLLNSNDFEGLNVGDLAKEFREKTREVIYDYEEHVEVGEHFEAEGHLPATFMAIAPGSWHTDVWDDVNRMLTLNGEQRRRNLQMHVCPLQLDIVNRLIDRYSNEGDLVYDPFGGLMTVPYCAIKKNRRGGASELNGDYFDDGVNYLRQAETDRNAMTLFDFEETTEGAEAS
jgi:DNA modification methylase